MERIGIRELRNETSKVVQRAKSGERIIVTIDGVPAAQLGPIDETRDERTLDRAAGDGCAAAAPDHHAAHDPPRPSSCGRGRATTTDVLLEDRGA